VIDVLADGVDDCGLRYHSVCSAECSSHANRQWLVRELELQCVGRSQFCKVGSFDTLILRCIIRHSRSSMFSRETRSCYVLTPKNRKLLSLAPGQSPVMIKLMGTQQAAAKLCVQTIARAALEEGHCTVHAHAHQTSSKADLRQPIETRGSTYDKMESQSHMSSRQIRSGERHSIVRSREF
jgi:hypothetical protein